MQTSPYRDRLIPIVRESPPLDGVFFRAIPAGSSSHFLEPGYSFQGDGRYNPRGVMSAVYLCDDQRRAPTEANLTFDHSLYEVTVEKLARVVRLDSATFAKLGLSRPDVTRPRISSKAFQQTHALAIGALQAEAIGLLVPSALHDATEEDWNLVILTRAPDPAWCYPRVAAGEMRS